LVINPRIENGKSYGGNNKPNLGEVKKEKEDRDLWGGSTNQLASTTRFSTAQVGEKKLKVEEKGGREPQGAREEEALWSEEALKREGGNECKGQRTEVSGWGWGGCATMGRVKSNSEIFGCGEKCFWNLYKTKVNKPGASNKFK